MRNTRQNQVNGLILHIHTALVIVCTHNYRVTDCVLLNQYQEGAIKRLLVALALPRQGATRGLVLWGGLA